MLSFLHLIGTLGRQGSGCLWQGGSWKAEGLLGAGLVLVLTWVQ